MTERLARHLESVTFQKGLVNMDFTPQQHRLWVSNFFNGKVKEFGFHLKWIVKCSDQSMADFQAGQNQAGSSHGEVLFAFSSFSNSIQTLKDAGSVFLEPKIVWGDIDQLRHGEFMHNSRNAATHDGNPIISGWTDGRFYIPRDIRRFNERGQLIEIPAPKTDVRTFCLEFAQDFSALLSAKLRPLENSEGPKPAISEIEDALQSPLVPEFVRAMLQEHKGAVEQKLSEVKVFPARYAIDALIEIEAFCTAELQQAQ